MIRIIINSHTVRKEFSNTGGLVPRDGLSSVGNAIKRHSGNNGICIVFLWPICLTFQWSSQSQSMFCLLFSFIHSHWPLSHHCFASGLSSDLQTLYLLVIELGWLQSPNSPVDLSLPSPNLALLHFVSQDSKAFHRLVTFKGLPCWVSKGGKKPGLSVEGDMR